jgi:L,D-transpeptidase YcbB
MKSMSNRTAGRCGPAIRRLVLLTVPIALTFLGMPRNVALAVGSSPTPAAQPSTPLPQLPSNELARLVAAGSLSDLRWPNFAAHQAEIAKFYAAGGYTPAWVSQGQPTAQAKALIELLKDSALKGLDPNDYDASRWDARLATLAPANPHPTEDALDRFDLALTVCGARYLSDLHVGRVNPQSLKFGLGVGPKRSDLADLLRGQMMQARDVGAVVASVEPQYQGYLRAETALADYLKLAAQADSAPVPVPTKSVYPGDSYAGIAPLTARLHQLGDLAPSVNMPPGTTIYGGALVDAVKRFQRRNGLGADGTLGAETVAQLNVPLNQRVKQLDFALERYRWIPPSFPQPPIVVNLPEFKLRTMRRQPAPFLSMRVVVGKAYRHRTPVFADYMRYVIFRPYWNVPMSIQFAELVPKIERNRNYLADHGFEVTSGDGAVVTDGAVSDATLSQLRAGALTIRQKPGPKNALGLVKFIFPNSYNVYLHSTPTPELFLKARRDFSHGCIRVQDPVALAAWVLRDDPEWTVDKIRSTMNGDQTVQVNLKNPIPVLILYSTAVVEPDGEVRFFRDIYGYDSELERAINSRFEASSG